jgi:YcxB-like protein
MTEHTVKYTITKAHLIYFSFYHMLRQNVIRVMFAIPIIFVAWRLSVLADHRHFPFYLKITVVVAAILAMMVLILSLHLVMSLLIYAGRGKDPGVLTSHTLTLNENGIIKVTPFVHSDQNWKSVVEVRRTRNFILIYTQRHAAHLIPLGAFASRQEAAEFYNFAHNHWKEALTN